MKRCFSILLFLLCLLFPAGCRSLSDAPPISIISNGEEILPHVNSLWNLEWTGDSWLSSDLSSISMSLPEIYDDLSTIIYSKDFTIQYQTGTLFSSLSVFNEAFERIHHNAELSLLDTLPEGNYYICIVISEQGRYIASEEKYEMSGYECVFHLIK